LSLLSSGKFEQTTSLGVFAGYLAGRRTSLLYIRPHSIGSPVLAAMGHLTWSTSRRGRRNLGPKAPQITDTTGTLQVWLRKITKRRRFVTKSYTASDYANGAAIIRALLGDVNMLFAVFPVK
jgi:hypothetical protein